MSLGGRGARTRLKLEEAEFFLQQLERSYGKQRKFDFYLSAFISAARSVGWVMRSEYHEVDGWAAWRQARPSSDEERALLRGTNAVRIRTTKQEPLQTMILKVGEIHVPPEFEERVSAAIAASPDGMLSYRVGGVPGAHYAELELDGTVLRFPAEGVEIQRSLDEFPGRQILEVCRAYYEYLATLVRECAERFDGVAPAA